MSKAASERIHVEVGMAFTTPEDLKDALMRGHKLTRVELDEFIAANQGEGQLYDYKGGELTDKPNREDGKKTIREYVTGFANAEGGVLIIGPADKPPHTITGCQKIGNQEVADWAKDNLLDVAGMFSPAPRFWTVKHPAEDVLLIATERAPQLIPVIESRKIRYHLRIGTSTVQVPEYLISDLVLGRRKHAVLDLKIRSREWRDVETTIGQNARHLVMTFNLENRSLVRAEKVQVGIVGWTLKGGTMNDYVLTYVEPQEPTILLKGAASWSVGVSLLSNRDAGAGPLSPFEHKSIGGFLSAPIVPCFNVASERVSFTLYRCAVYLAPEGSPPTWFQVDATIVRPEHEEPHRVEAKCYRVAYSARPVLACFLGDEAREVAKSLESQQP